MDQKTYDQAVAQKATEEIFPASEQVLVLKVDKADKTEPKQLVNPRMVQTWHEKFSDRARGTKFYRTGFELPGHAKFSRRTSKTASEAEDYGVRVLLRWFRLYDAAVLAMTSSSPAVTEEEQVVAE